MQVDVECVYVVAVVIYQRWAKPKIREGHLPDKGEEVMVGGMGLICCNGVSVKGVADREAAYSRCGQEPKRKSAGGHAQRTENIPVSWCRSQLHPPKSAGCP